MRIGFEAKRAFHNARGLGSYARGLIEGLGVYYPENDYFLYTPPFKTTGRDWFKKYPKMALRTPKNFLLRTLGPLRRSLFLSHELKDDGLDLFHGLSHELPFGIEASGVKTAVTIHDLLFMRYPHLFSPIDRTIYYYKWKYSIGTADSVIAVCEQTKEDILQFFTVSEDKVRVVYQSCHPRYYTPCSKEAIERIEKKYGLPAKYILYVGAIEENKNTFSLVKAFSLLGRQDASLVLVGEGKSYKEMIEREVRDLGIEDRVYFLGRIPDDDLPAVYQAAQFFVYPSFFEGFGRPILEAFFSGKAVITSDSSGMKEAGGGGALYIDPDSIKELKEAMECLLDDGHQRKLLAHQGRNHAEKFHHQKTSKAMMAVYSELLSWGKGP